MTWDESKHPRNPSGSPKGGEFKPKGRSAQDDLAAEKRHLKNHPRLKKLQAELRQQQRLGADTSFRSARQMQLRTERIKALRDDIRRIRDNTRAEYTRLRTMGRMAAEGMKYNETEHFPSHGARRLASLVKEVKRSRAEFHGQRWIEPSARQEASDRRKLTRKVLRTLIRRGYSKQSLRRFVQG